MRYSQYPESYNPDCRTPAITAPEAFVSKKHVLEAGSRGQINRTRSPAAFVWRLTNSQVNGPWVVRGGFLPRPPPQRRYQPARVSLDKVYQHCSVS